MVVGMDLHGAFVDDQEVHKVVEHLKSLAKPQYIDAMMNWEDPLYRKIVDALPANSKPSDYITSLDVTAAKRR